ncbi:MAG: nitrogen fixation protein NifQ [Gammaproteobacteria bacterium]|jgi:nitrogen fixation protein NifQ
MGVRQAAWHKGEEVGCVARGVYAELMAHRCGHPNDHGLACIHATWVAGGGILPNRLGLTPLAYARLRHHHFPGTRVGFAIGRYGRVDSHRRAEWEDLRALLLAHRADRDESEEWVADIFVAACMGSDHLWQDLGLWSRRDLSVLFRHNFPTLMEKNVGDMKWKKFLYKQLCLQQGIYVCRAPSCEVCQDYRECFGAEEVDH